MKNFVLLVEESLSLSRWERDDPGIMKFIDRYSFPLSLGEGRVRGNGTN